MQRGLPTMRSKTATNRKPPETLHHPQADLRLNLLRTFCPVGVVDVVRFR